MTESPTPLRIRIEDVLGAWAQIVWRFRWVVVIAILAMTGWLASYVPLLEIKMATEDFLFEDDPVRGAYDRFKEEFGHDQIAMLAVSPPEIFDFAFLEKLRAFHEDLEDEVPYLEEITSLVNVRSTYGRDDELVVDDLLEEMPTTQAELEALRERVLSTPLYLKTGLLSNDGRSTAVRVEVAVYSSTGSDDGEGDDILAGFEDEGDAKALTGKRPFLSGRENSELIEAIHAVIARHQSPDFPILAGGGTLLTYEITGAMGRDVPRFFGGGLVVMGGLLILLFRRLSPVLLCFAVVVPAVIATFGLSALFGLAFSAPSQLVPSFLLAIGVSYGVHLVTIFLRDLAGGQTRLEALEHALRHSGVPVVMTGVTTCAGVLSFLAAEMKPIYEMGLISAIGVGVMLVYAIVFLPALLAIFPIQPKPTRQMRWVDALLGSLAALSARHPWRIVAGCGLLLILSFLAMTRLYTSSNPTSWFPEQHPYRIAADDLNERFGGQSALELIVDTGRENGLHEPEMMRRLAALEGVVDDLRAGGAALTHTNSVVDVARETHQALNGNDRAYHVLPSDRKLLAQELLLFENSGNDDLEKLVDSQFSRARYTIRSSWQDGALYVPLIEQARPLFLDVLGESASLEITGMSNVIARTVGAVTQSLIRSYALALALITPLMILLIGSLRSGLVSMVPNLVPIFATLGMMGIFGIPLDMFTLTAGCIAIGLAVDDSIHFISGFRRYLALGHDPVRAVEETMQTTGRALLFTSIVLTSGFAVLLLSDMLNLRQVGTLISFAIGTAFLLDVTVTPALLVLTHRRYARG
ncbi:MAG: hypothetical protein CL908_06515 [Deltaproteobacteria bacterium]|nr:hypothetical protein [Deltaproteobacteria bacterium]